MTNYSKLTDAEIAEKVAVKLGWKKPRISNELGLRESVEIWLRDQHRLSPMLWKDRKNNILTTYLQILKSAFFDWPAPIMMQAVKRELAKRGFEYEIGFDTTEEKHYGVTISEEFYNVDYEEYHALSLSEHRALYEAFLQAVQSTKEK